MTLSFEIVETTENPLCAIKKAGAAKLTRLGRIGYGVCDAFRLRRASGLLVGKRIRCRIDPLPYKQGVIRSSRIPPTTLKTRTKRGFAATAAPSDQAIGGKPNPADRSPFCGRSTV